MSYFHFTGILHFPMQQINLMKEVIIHSVLLVFIIGMHASCVILFKLQNVQIADLQLHRRRKVSLYLFSQDDVWNNKNRCKNLFILVFVFMFCTKKRKGYVPSYILSVYIPKPSLRNWIAGVKRKCDKLKCFKFVDFYYTNIYPLRLVSSWPIPIFRWVAVYIESHKIIICFFIYSHAEKIWKRVVRVKPTQRCAMCRQHPKGILLT